MSDKIKILAQFTNSHEIKRNMHVVDLKDLEAITMQDAESLTEFSCDENQESVNEFNRT
jgi:hypothetical protein